ncbi:MAG TPA: c-type cytochrome [Gaiellaceae bacterium]
MNTRLTLAVFASLAAVFAAVPAAYSRLASSPASPAAGRQLYQADCAQCHLLSASLGPGTGTSGLGPSTGPAFNSLKLPRNIVILTLTERDTFPAHVRLVKRMNFQELRDIDAFLAHATKNHPDKLTLAATRACLKAEPLVLSAGASPTTTPGTFAFRASGGALAVSLSDGNSVILGFFGSSFAAGDALPAAKLAASGLNADQPAQEAYTDGNVALNWADQPTAAETQALAGCIR